MNSIDRDFRHPALVRAALPQAKRIAAGFAKSRPSIPFEDFRAEALVGLWDADRRYDSKRNPNFRVFVQFVITNRLVNYVIRPYKTIKSRVTSQALRWDTCDGHVYRNDDSDCEVALSTTCRDKISQHTTPEDVAAYEEQRRIDRQLLRKLMRFLSPGQRRAVALFANDDSRKRRNILEVNAFRNKLAKRHGVTPQLFWQQLYAARRKITRRYGTLAKLRESAKR